MFESNILKYSKNNGEQNSEVIFKCYQLLFTAIIGHLHLEAIKKQKLLLHHSLSQCSNNRSVKEVTIVSGNSHD